MTLVRYDFHNLKLLIRSIEEIKIASLNRRKLNTNQITVKKIKSLRLAK